MPTPSTLVSRLKVQLKLSISRLRMIQQKDTALAKQQRRAMAQLLEQDKLESARIRVENIIRSDITTELHEILELYCELLIARSQLLDPPTSPLRTDPPTVDPGLEEAVRSIIYAAPRTEIKELHAARALLVEKFGKEFSVSAVDGEGVADRVLKKLAITSPPPELVDAYLREIGRTYGVRFPGDPPPTEEDDSDEGDGGTKVKALEAPIEAEELSRATPPTDLGVSSPVRIAPASPSTENVTPKIKLPGQGAAKARRTSEGRLVGGSVPDVDELSKRFAALKR
ncbi:DUF292-domain-containing protein [Trichodelitschia bisporula]|uniref:DUF292-domain-containing protein n=1 Tax=Trichodelitschia bisporula TaxID=703511 RepID=A0A6G1I1D3_9PEZI|nr:DUF292-domain-containing protein [Trichodelitschia bisporula]